MSQFAVKKSQPCDRHTTRQSCKTGQRCLKEKGKFQSRQFAVCSPFQHHALLLYEGAPALHHETFVLSRTLLKYYRST